MKGKLRWILPLCAAFILILFLIGYYNLKPRLKYILDENTNTYLVSKAFGNSKKYVVPEKYNGKVVSGIDERAFFRHDNLEEIEFEKGSNITIIKKLAFSECRKLKKIDLSNVKTIERNAFSYDDELDDLTIGAENIGSSAFYKCISLKNITLKEGLKTVGAFTFSYNTFTSIKIPKSITKVYDDAFKYCDKLDKIEVYYSFDNQYLKGLKGYTKYYD